METLSSPCDITYCFMLEMQHVCHEQSIKITSGLIWCGTFTLLSLPQSLWPAGFLPAWSTGHCYTAPGPTGPRSQCGAPYRWCRTESPSWTPNTSTPPRMPEEEGRRVWFKYTSESVNGLDSEVSKDDKARLSHALISQRAVILGPVDTKARHTHTHMHSHSSTLSVFLSCLTKTARFSFKDLTMSAGLLWDLPNSGMMDARLSWYLGNTAHTRATSRSYLRQAGCTKSSAVILLWAGCAFSPHPHTFYNYYYLYYNQ